MDFELNDQQIEAGELARKWFLHSTKQCFELSGPAGSGKTTIVEWLTRMVGLEQDEVLYMALVGKAAMMLTLRGNPARTIHSTIYEVRQLPRLDENGNPIKKNGRVLTRIGFVLKKELPARVKLLVVDEGSMLNAEIARDILSFGLPVLVLGDLNQLPPVFGNPYFLNKPDYTLTKIMRQKEDDPIIRLSQMAIRGEQIRPGKYGNKCFVITKDMITDKLMKHADIVICGKNDTRQKINDYFRRNIKGITQKNTPIIGDKIICRQNNWGSSIDESIFLINGLIGYIDALYLDTYDKKSISIDFRPEFMKVGKFEKIPMDFEYLFQPVTIQDTNRFNTSNKFQFAYAITAHLAQGSQYDNVLVYDERVGSRDYYRKWLYTALTRAVSGLVLAID